MDHKVSKDMISSGMIPSGEKTQADLGKTQYGSAPSPNKLMDAYKSMYEHHQKDKDGNTIPHEGEELNEGKIPAGLQAYLDKKKGKTEDKKEVKEEIDIFDTILEHYLNEGYQREDIIKAMSSLNEEPITLATIGALLAKGGAMAAKGAAVAAKGAMGAAKAGGAAVKGAMKGVVSAAKPVTKTVSKVATKIKKDPMGAIDNVRRVTDTVDSAKNLVSPTQRQEKKVAAGTASTGSNIASSADLFDIVKGQLLDEGLSEEEIKDIMLTLTPDEIMKEMNQGPSTPVKNYGDSPDKPKILPNFGATRAKPRTTDKGTIIKGGKDTGKTPAQMSQEEYKNFDPKKPDPKQMAAQAKQEKIRQKNNDPMGVKNRNIGGQGLDPMDK